MKITNCLFIGIFLIILIPVVYAQVTWCSACTCWTYQGTEIIPDPVDIDPSKYTHDYATVYYKDGECPNLYYKFGVPKPLIDPSLYVDQEINILGDDARFEIYHVEPYGPEYSSGRGTIKTVGPGFDATTRWTILRDSGFPVSFDGLIYDIQANNPQDPAYDVQGTCPTIVPLNLISSSVDWDPDYLKNLPYSLGICILPPGGGGAGFWNGIPRMTSGGGMSFGSRFTTIGGVPPEVTTLNILEGLEIQLPPEEQKALEEIVDRYLFETMDETTKEVIEHIQCKVPPASYSIFSGVGSIMAEGFGLCTVALGFVAGMPSKCGDPDCSRKCILHTPIDLWSYQQAITFGTEDRGPGPIFVYNTRECKAEKMGYPVPMIKVIQLKDKKNYVAVLDGCGHTWVPSKPDCVDEIPVQSVNAESFDSGFEIPSGCDECPEGQECQPRVSNDLFGPISFSCQPTKESCVCPEGEHCCDVNGERHCGECCANSAKLKYDGLDFAQAGWPLNSNKQHTPPVGSNVNPDLLERYFLGGYRSEAEYANDCKDGHDENWECDYNYKCIKGYARLGKQWVLPGDNVGEYTVSGIGDGSVTLTTYA
jgi:hypothetical protein